MRILVDGSEGKGSNGSVTIGRCLAVAIGETGAEKAYRCEQDAYGIEVSFHSDIHFLSQFGCKFTHISAIIGHFGRIIKENKLLFD